MAAFDGRTGHNGPCLVGGKLLLGTGRQGNAEIRSAVEGDGLVQALDVVHVNRGVAENLMPKHAHPVPLLEHVGLNATRISAASQLEVFLFDHGVGRDGVVLVHFGVPGHDRMTNARHGATPQPVVVHHAPGVDRGHSDLGRRFPQFALGISGHCRKAIRSLWWQCTKFEVGHLITFAARRAAIFSPAT